MEKLKSGIVLEDGEKLIYEIEAELWAISANPIAKFFGAITKFISAILGNRKKGYLIITDKRVIEVSQEIICYCFNAGKNINYILPTSVKEIGYMLAPSCGCFCQTAYVYYSLGFGLKTTIQIKTGEQDAKNICNSFYEVLLSKNINA